MKAGERKKLEVISIEDNPMLLRSIMSENIFY